VVPLHGAIRFNVWIPDRKRTSQRHSALGGKQAGRYIRHAGPWVAPPIFALAIAMVLAPFRTLLVAAVGQAVLLPARLLPTEVAAVVLSPVTVATDPEDLATTAGTTNSLTQDNFGEGRHPRPKVGLDNGDRSWQLETNLVFGYLMKVCHTGNSTALTVGFPFPTGGDQAIR
jgi:hypothetical protein